MQSSLLSPLKTISTTSANQPIHTATKTQWLKKSCEDWHRFSLSLIPGSMDRDNSARNHWFRIAQIQKNGVLQVVASVENVCDQNTGKPSNPTSPRPHMHLETSFQTMGSFTLNVAFSLFPAYLRPLLLHVEENIPPEIEIGISSNWEVRHSPGALVLSDSSNPNTPDAK